MGGRGRATGRAHTLFSRRMNNQFRTVSNKGNPTVYLKHSIAMAATGVDAM